MTNQVTDHGLLSSTMEGIRETDRSGIVEVVADKGYEEAEADITSTKPEE